jgi:predicted MPP superfamily phosphohydrolase
MLLITRKHMNEFIFLSDVIVIVGDLVDGLVTDLKDAVQPLQNLKSKHGVLYVTGKKEYQEEKQKWSSLCNR